MCVSALFVKKIRTGFWGRRKLTTRLCHETIGWPPQANRYWFHFSSAGEFEQALPILEKLKIQSPSCRIALTYFSPSAKRAVQLEEERRKKAGLAVPWDFQDFSPFDFSWSCARFLDFLKPTAFVAINKEIWPELLFQCHLRKVPTYLFAAHLSDSVQRRWFFYQSFLKRMRHIGTVNQTSAEFLQEKGLSSNVTHSGDPRSERVLYRRNLFQTGRAWMTFFFGSPVWIGASLWDSDLKAILPGLKSVLESNPSLRLVFVPHEPSEHRLRHWKEILSAQGISTRRWSHWLQTPDDHSHLIVDRVGFLAELYSIATVVLVGGSFKQKVHNVLEPAAYSNAIVVGPFIQNSFEATEMNRLQLGLKSAKTSQEASETILKRISDVSFL
ncbi:MAG: hypothetical protein EB120_14230, partial [Proteobacteria bacterium]|nr:hypothetical protein [Pseudomonadota bacterium]